MTIDATDHRTPGQLIEALLADRGWTKRTLAIVLAVDETTVAKWTSDRQPVNANIAVLLEEAFDVPAERFLELQRSFDLVKARHVARPDPGRKNRAHLFGGLPIAEMIKRCWIDAEDARDVPSVERSLAKFFGVATPDEIPILPHAAKKKDVGPEVTPPQLAWLYRVNSIASGMLVAPYSPQAVKAAVSKLALLRQSPEELRKVPRILAEAGIRFVIVQSLESAKIDGVCFWLDDHSPVIGMSLRFDRIDNFWFVLRHELQHVIERHGLVSPVIDAELEGAKAGTGVDIPEEERIANEAAAEFCVPDAQMKAFIVRKAPFYSERDLLGFARTIGVHPGLVAGQLQRRTERYDRFRNHLVKIRGFVSPGAMVDGWGDVAPID